MAKSRKKREAATPLRIEGDLTIYRAAELKELLLGELGKRECLDLDLEAVSDVDTAGVQLLMLAKREAAAHAHTLRIVAHSRAVVDALECLHLASYFGDPIVLPANG